MNEDHVELYINGAKEYHKLNIGKGPELELQQKVQLYTTFVCTNIFENLVKKDQFKENVKQQELNKVVDKMDAKLNSNMDEIKKYKVLQRKAMMHFCLQTNELIGKFYEVLKKNILLTDQTSFALYRQKNLIFKEWNTHEIIELYNLSI